MPAAAKRKLEAALPPAVDDGPRAALAAAISAHAEAQKAVELKQQTVRRALDGIGAAEKKLEKCRAAVAEAKEKDAKSAAAHLDKAAVPDTPWHLRNALSDVETAERTIEIADAAYRRLRNDLVGLEDDVAAAQNDVIVAIKELTRPVVEELMAELVEARRRAAITIRVLSELLADDAKLSFHDGMRDLRAAKARAAPFADLKAEAEHLLCGPSNEDHEAALGASKEMKEALRQMQTNAVHPLPKV